MRKGQLTIRNWTRRYVPYELLYYELNTKESEARSRERFINARLQNRYQVNRMKRLFALL